MSGPRLSLDLRRRPGSYWRGPAARIGRAVSNLERERARCAVSGDGASYALPAWVIDAANAEGSPFLAGGTRLPGLHPGEVEIVRFHRDPAESCQATSLRARRAERGRIAYRILSEWDEWTWQLPFRTSRKPLTVGQVIRLLNGTTTHITKIGTVDLVDLLLAGRLGCDSPLVPMRALRVDSAFYPELKTWLDHRVQWSMRRCGKWTAREIDAAKAVVDAEWQPAENVGDPAPRGPRAHDCLLPQGWPHTDLDIGVSLQLDERLNNCVYSGFWVDFAACSLEHAVDRLRSSFDSPLIYWGFLPLEQFAFDATLTHQVTGAVHGDVPKPRCRRRDLEHPLFEHTGMPAVITLHNRFVGGSTPFRPQLTICGRSRDDAARTWREIADRLRSTWPAPERAEPY